MVKKIYFLVGGILLAVAIFVFVIIGTAFTSNTAVPESEKYLGPLLQYCISGFLTLLASIFLVAGFRAKAREKKEKELYDRIMLTGVKAAGTITFVDKNWSIRINSRPIYSIVEYVYKDSAGIQHTNRNNQSNSEWVIRNQIQVGKNVEIKYAAEDPSKSILIG
jgi:hypothetical protein